MSDAPAPQTIVSSGMPWVRARARTRAFPIGVGVDSRKRLASCGDGARRGACRIHVHREVDEVGGAPFASDAERLRAAPMRTGAQDSPGSPGRGVVFPHTIAPTASTTAARAAPKTTSAHTDAASMSLVARAMSPHSISRDASPIVGFSTSLPKYTAGPARRSPSATPVAAPDARRPARVEPDDRAHGDHEQG